MRISISWAYQQSLATMQAQQSALAASQNEVSTGTRVNLPSDDPAAAAQIVGIGHTLAQNTQYAANIAGANTRLATEESTLDSVTDLLDRARTLGLGALDGSLSAQDLQGIGTELGQIRDQLLQYANARDANGNALFAGTGDSKAPFVRNADGSVSYQGTAVQQRAAIGHGLTLPTGDTGAAVFMDIPAGNGDFVASAGAANQGSLVVGANSVTDPARWTSSVAAAGGGFTISFGAGGHWTVQDAAGKPLTDAAGQPLGGDYADGGSIAFEGLSISLSGTPAAGDTVHVTTGTTQNVFATLDGMIASLQGGNATQLGNAMNRQLESLDRTLDTVASTQVAIGGRLDVLGQQGAAYASLGVTYQSALSNARDADPYQAISQLSLQSAALQASQQVFVAVKSLSLFNYLR
ncbi:flagellar hook-associated protein FlgL [Fulvimonas sp. R45]|uniref:flagellar hook-associated protein FlgL n=1 Tax=Fulvimonas sp. R45 TaxID=3045937 RepID=UPI00265EF689|nr:flagellar hook-associated protein FlgL [Fulvimonas sp. R45]MDO1528345.1 flagellar hook-associated protein FlgL [Fulvimonas sp. R45]